MVNEDSGSLAEKAARMRNEAEEQRKANKIHDEKWHRFRKRLYYTLVGTPMIVTAGLLIFLLVDKLWQMIAS
jgi:hypothetical protein